MNNSLINILLNSGELDENLAHRFSALTDSPDISPDDIFAPLAAPTLPN
ncbi:hypothetical protein [Vibrio taketomensis]|nr:hypothetical protein [Vibrio taketomensis]